MKKIRIALMRSPWRTLTHWEQRLILEIDKHPYLDLVLLIGDDRKNPTIERGKGKFFSFTKLINFLKIYNLTNMVWMMLIWFEKRLVKISPQRVLTAALQEKANAIYRNLPACNLSPTKRGLGGCIDYFSDADTVAINHYKLDVILRHEFGFIKGSISQSATYGIWSLHHGDNNLNRGGPAGFWECYFDQPVVGVTLQKITDELDGGLIIDKAWHPLVGRKWLPTRELLLEQSVTLVTKNLNLLSTGIFNPVASRNVYSWPLFKKPELHQIIKYVAVCHIAARLIYIYKSILAGRPTDRAKWQIHIGANNLFGAVLWKSKVLKPPPREFWADPFLLRHQNKTLIYFERYCYLSQKATIACGELDDNGSLISHPIDLLMGDYHFSYPFLHERNGEIIMLPETSSNRRLEIWRATEMPYKWELWKTALEGKSIGDPTIYKDKDGIDWLFLNISEDSFGDHDSFLYIYQIADWEEFTLIPHKLNPVITDVRFARSAGSIFIDSNGRVVRPVQQKLFGEYGKTLALVEIAELSLDIYRQVLLEVVEAKWDKHISRIHHLSIIDGSKYFAFDTMNYP